MANYKMEIFFDTDKIEKDSILVMVDKICAVAEQKYFETDFQNGILKIQGTGNNDDFANIGILISSLKRKEWFVSSIYKWLFYDSGNGVEDLYYRYNLCLYKK